MKKSKRRKSLGRRSTTGKARKRKKISRKRRVKAAKKKVEKIKAVKPKTDSQTPVHRTRIRIIGLGGGGGSIVSEIAHQLKRADFVVCNTDTKALKEASRHTKVLPFGQKITGGLGCGMDAKLGQKAARDDENKIAKLFKGIDLSIIVASLGGGTGSGAAPEFAKIGKESGSLVYGIFTLPFKFEGGKKSYIAKNALEKLTPNLNAISLIPNENIFKIIDKKTPLKEAFSTINRRLTENLRGLLETIYLPGLINIDFADVKTILEGRGKLVYLNSAQAQGPNRVEEALKDLLKSPLNEYDIRGAEKMIFDITASQNIGMKEVEQISRTIADFNRRAKIIFGVTQDNDYKDKIRIFLLAVGCGKADRPKAKPQPKAGPPRAKKPKKKRRKKPSSAKATAGKAKRKPGKKTKKAKRKQASVSVPVEEEKTEAPAKALTRRNALDLRKEVEKVEEEMEEKDKKWDIPAFLRRKTEGNE